MALNRLSRFEACRYEYIDSLCRLGEVLLAFASFVFTMVTFGTPFWLARGSPVDDVEQLHYHMGLWQNCTVLESCKALPLTGSAVPGKEKGYVRVGIDTLWSPGNNSREV